MDYHTCRSAIRTKYVGPTDHRGSRISATGPARDSWGDKTCRVMYDWDYAIDVRENHAAAAQAWADKYLSEFSDDYSDCDADVGARTYKPIIDREGLYFGGCHFWSWSWKSEV